MTLIEDIRSPEVEPAVDMMLTLEEVKLIYKALAQYWRTQPFHPGLNDETLAMVEQFQWIKDRMEEAYDSNRA